MVSDLLPASLLALLLTIVSAASLMLPFGPANLLVRTGDPSPASVLLLAARSGAALIAVPAPGYAVLHGDAARVRAASGLAVIWKGRAACSID